MSISIERFGKDHWAALAYVETVCVDGQQGLGTLDRRRMRCNVRRHPLLAGVYGIGQWQPSWGTRLAGFFEFAQRDDLQASAAAGLRLLEHDDWDCLDDLASAGLCDIISLANDVVRMTPAGMKATARLREHKARGGNYAGFVMAEPVAAS